MDAALVLLPGACDGAPVLPGGCTVTTADRAERPPGCELWVDRPYFTGNPTIEWAAGRVRDNDAAGAFTQLGNEPNLPAEGWQGGPQNYQTFYRQVMAASGSHRILYAPISPKADAAAELDAWVRDRVAPCYAVHAYGSFGQMSTVVEWYLANVTGDLFVTECNPGAGNVFDLAAWARDELAPFLDWCAEQPRVRMVAYFAWRWDQSAKLPTSIDADGCPAVVDALRGVRKEPTNVLRIVDVSNYQGIIDMSGWRSAGIDGVVVRLSQDGCDLDPFGPANWRQAGMRGLLRGAYHLSQPDIASPADSLTLFGHAIDNAGGLAPGDVLVHDAELGPDTDLAQWTAEFGAAAKEKFGFECLLYSAHWWMGPHNLEIEGVAEQYAGLWAANYTGDPLTQPWHVPGWNHLVMVQYTASGSVPGVQGPVDLSSFFGTRGDWLALGKPADAAGEPATVDPVDDALNNLWALTEDTAKLNQARAVSAQRAIDVLKARLRGAAA